MTNPTYDLGVWCWARNAERGDPEAVYRDACEERTHPAICEVDFSPFERLLGESFGNIHDGERHHVLLNDLPGETDPPVAFVEVPWHHVEEVLPLLGTLAARLELSVWDPQAGRLVSPSRPKSFAFEMEGGKPVYDPTPGEVLDALGLLNAATGPSFALLAAGDGRFLQVSGTVDGVVVERGAPASDGLLVEAARRPDGPEGTRTVELAGGDSLERPGTEVFSLAGARAILAAFHRGEPFPPGLVWRPLPARG